MENFDEFKAEECEWDESKHEGKPCPFHSGASYGKKYGATGTKYHLEGFGYIKKSAYENIKKNNPQRLKDIRVEETPIPNEPSFLKQYPKFKKELDIKDVTKGTNPNYETGNYKWTYNCQRCVVAWEMRFRGYDVTAKPRLPAEEDDIFKQGSHWKESFKDLEWDYPDYIPGDDAGSARLIDKAIEDAGCGARFVVHIVNRQHRWDKTERTGHVFIAIVNPIGKAEYYDGQTGKRAVWRYNCDPSRTSIARIDDKELTDKVSNCVYIKGEEPKTTITGNVVDEEEESKWKKI